MEDTLFITSLIVLGTGAALAAAGSVSFFVRAVLNKKAWDGLTRPLLATGAIVAIVGLILLYFTYPK
ncbi:MAG: hypothetical protein LBQ11_01395 [Candidatus Nomurabacteria bacterium]|jgi:hypothetical protein|nr:hypothetical protein [Candidatus Nomurabacteria bacterium]